MRILYLASVPALDTGASSVVMLRHLRRLLPGHDLAYVCDQPGPALCSNHLLLRQPLWLRIARRTRFGNRAVDYGDAFAIGYSLASVRKLVREFRPEVIITVALGPLHIVARRIAKRHGVPLVSFFHDWSPAWFKHSALARRKVGRQLLETYRSSAVTLCISPEFRDRLGSEHPNSQILAPIPAGPPWTGGVSSPPASLAVYAGAAHGIYLDQTLGLFRSLPPDDGDDTPVLRYYGPTPHWPAHDLNNARARGVIGGFLKRETLELNLASAPALLVTVPFDPRFEAIARYSFPSKIAEYCRFARPIVLWAPEHSAAAAWARRSSAAMLVTSPDPAQAFAALKQLAQDPAQRGSLSTRAAAAAADEFLPDRLHQILEDALHFAARKTPPGILR